jgi:ribokinase
MKKRILVVGSSNTDLIIKVPEIPRPGETLLGGEFMTFPGGKGANQAVAAARAGGEVDFIASVGDDSYGTQAIRGYEQDRIHTGNIKVCEGVPSGIAMITISDQGENAIVVASGANAELHPKDLEKAATSFRDADVMLIQLEIPMDTVQKAVDLGHQLGTRVILNPAPAAELPDHLLHRVSIITPNETEAGRLTGISVSNEQTAAKASEALHKKGLQTVIITLGALGAYVSDNRSGIRTLVPGFNVRAVDTTAAGDVFNGQLAVSLAEGRPLDLAVREAHAAAALSVRKLGAQSSIPYREETAAFLKENTNQKT